MNTQAMSEETSIVVLEESSVLRSGGFSWFTLLGLRPAQFCTGASDQGWEPGFWPQTVSLRGETFVAETMESSPECELVAVRYRSASGSLVSVLND